MEFKFKDITWKQRKELKQILFDVGITTQKIANAATNGTLLEWPPEFVEKIFAYAVVGFDDVNKLNDLSDTDLLLGASEAYINIFIKPEEQKKS